MKRDLMTMELDLGDCQESEAPPVEVINLIARGALFVVNHSGGKDSQAMYLLLRQYVPAAQLVIVHADLGPVEWAGAVDHIKATTAGEPLHVCRARRTLLQMIEERGMFPSPQQRQCTSDLKRGPIERTIRGLVEDRVTDHIGVPRGTPARFLFGRGAAMEEGAGLVVNCMGMRAEESTTRAKLVPFKHSASNSKAGREWYDWLPVHSWSEKRVFDKIASEHQKPHIVYQLGMRRFSCIFCIYAADEDLTTAATLVTTRPELANDPNVYRNYAGLERSTGQVMMMPKNGVRRSLEQITGVAA